MALSKSIEQEDGVVTTYHRILFIQSMINKHDSIAVGSYVNATSRSGEEEGKRPYKSCITFEKDYQEDMTVEDAYSYLKTLPEFEGAEDC